MYMRGQFLILWLSIGSAVEGVAIVRACPVLSFVCLCIFEPVYMCAYMENVLRRFI